MNVFGVVAYAIALGICAAKVELNTRSTTAQLSRPTTMVLVGGRKSDPIDSNDVANNPDYYVTKQVSTRTYPYRIQGLAMLGWTVQAERLLPLVQSCEKIRVNDCRRIYN